jgi:hypothetical protein
LLVQTRHSNISTGQALTFSFGIRYEEMVLQWMGEALEHLEK